MALTDYGWRPIEEGGKVIALAGADGNISLEPAGQFELSGAPLDNLHETCAETGRHLQQVKAIGEKSRDRLSRPRHVARQDAGRAADHAQGPLRDHAAPHAAVSDRWVST